MQAGPAAGILARAGVRHGAAIALVIRRIVAADIAVLAAVTLCLVAAPRTDAEEPAAPSDPACETAGRGAPELEQFRTFVEASPFADGTYWFLIRPLDYEIEHTDIHVCVPRGFVTDFASIPRPFWWLLPTWGKYGPPSIVHDYLYWDQRCTRAQADALMSLAMEESRVRPWWRHLIHGALRMGGGFAWRSNARARRAGEDREMPEQFIPGATEPTLTWQNVKATMVAAGHTPAPRPTAGPPPSYCARAERLWQQKPGGKVETDEVR